MSIRSRAWCFTLNNYTPDEERIVHELECTYLVCGREVGELGTPHLQGYVYFKNARFDNGVRSILRRAHWEVARSDHETNRTYCTKGGDYFETGQMPMSQKRKGEVEQERWQQAWKAAKVGDIDSVPYDIRFRHYNTLKQIAKDYMQRPVDLETLDNYWIYGPPGVGKSRAVRILFPEAYMKMCNKWWDGYQHEANVIIDDWELDMGKTLGHHLKIWAQNQSFIAEAKGSALHIRPKRIIVTSNYSIEEVFAHDQTLVQAINRRFNVHWLREPINFDVEGAMQQAGLPEPEPVSLIIPSEGPAVVEEEDGDSIPDIDLSIWDDDNNEFV